MGAAGAPGRCAPGGNGVAAEKSQNRKWPSERFSVLHLLWRFLGFLSTSADLVLASYFRFLQGFHALCAQTGVTVRCRYAAEASRGRSGRVFHLCFGLTHDSHRSFQGRPWASRYMYDIMA